MSNHRGGGGGGGGFRGRERDNGYRDRDSDRDRNWRDRERDWDSRRDSRFDDSRRRYDTHEGLERPLGDPYERNGDRRRPFRDYDRPPPRRFERDDRDYDRPPARFGPPGSKYDDVPRGPRAARRATRSPSPPAGPRFDRDAEHDRQAPLVPRRRSISPSSQSSSSRRPRSPDRRPLSPVPVDREKLRVASVATKSPLESGEEATDGSAPGRNTSSTATSASGSLSIRGSASAAASTAAPSTRPPLDARAIAAQRVTSKPPTSAGASSNAAELGNNSPRAASDAIHPSSGQARSRPATIEAQLQAPPKPSSPVIPTGPKAMREGLNSSAWQGPSRGVGPRGGQYRGGYASSSSQRDSYNSRLPQRDYREPPSSYVVQSEKRTAEQNEGAWGDDNKASARPTSPGPSRSPWHAVETPQKEIEEAWGSASTSKRPYDARSSPHDLKHGTLPGSSPVVRTKEQDNTWGGVSPSVSKDKQTGWPEEPASVGIARRDSKSGGSWPASGADQSSTSPGGWGHQSPHPSSESRRGFSHSRGRPFGGPDRGPRDSPYRFSHAKHQQEADELAKQKAAQGRLYEQEPWRVHLDTAAALRKKRDEELDKALLDMSALSRKALRDLEVLEGELIAVSLNRRLRKEHLDTFKETFMGDVGGYGSGDVAMI